MNVVYSSSDSYSEIAGISITSLLENNRDADDVTIYVIDNDISEQNRQNLETIVERYGRTLIFLDKLNIEEISGTKINVGRWHISTFFRLFLATLLPDTVDRVMYVDCDMIIRESLRPVWEMDMAGNYAMAADDCRGERYRADIGLKPDQLYVNNGFLLIDLKAWRENNIEQKYIEFISRYEGDVTYMDQGVLNGVLGAMKLVGLLPLKYNSQTVFYDFDIEEVKKYRNPVLAYTEAQVREYTKDPAIVHFTSSFISGTRPWNIKNDHAFRGEYLHYKSMTPWKDAPLREDDRKLAKKIMTVVCQVLPTNLMLAAISVVHTTLYPMVRNFKGQRKMRRVSAANAVIRLADQP